MIKRILLILTIFSFVFPTNKSGTAMFRWGEIETGTRALGMAGSQVASGNSISSLPYNPASIAYIEKSQVFVSKAAYLAETSHNTIAFGTQLSPSDYLGIHLYYFDSGSMNETSEASGGETGQSFKFTGLMLRTAYAKQVTDRLKIGTTLKFMRENTTSADLSASSFAVDVGSNFNTGIFGGTVLGMCISNFGPNARYKGDGLDIPGEETGDPSQGQEKTEYFPIPLTFRVGIMNHIIGPSLDAIINNPNHTLTLSFDFINPLDYQLYETMGMEYSWNEMFFVRSGYHLNHDTAGLSFGAGLEYKNIALDFAYANYQILKSTWQFGISYGF